MGCITIVTWGSSDKFLTRFIKNFTAVSLYFIINAINKNEYAAVYYVY